jgi:hypothetical protein
VPTASGARAPRTSVLVAVALAAVAAATLTMVWRLGSDHGGAEPGLQAGLLDWIILSYVFSGLVAWARRPDSRLGPLMIAAGFATFLSSLSSVSGTLPNTVGQ